MITKFHKETNEEVKKILNELNQTRRRVRIWYGDTKTGRSWNDEYDIMGYVGNSTGSSKIPLLVNNTRSFGGPGLLDHCIIRIDDIKAKKTLYKHDNFHTGLTLQNNAVYQWKAANHDLVALFETREKAENYIKFMNGERYSK